MRLRPIMKLTALLLAAGALTVVPSFATAITGIANIDGGVSVSPTTITFLNNVFGVPLGATETGAFAGLTGGQIQNLTGGPVTGATSVVDFATFNQGVATPVFFDLTFIAPGTGSVAGCLVNLPSQPCTPPGSPFTLTQVSSSTVMIALQMDGLSYTGSSSSGASSATTSIFTTQDVAPGTVTSIYNTLLAGNPIAGATYSASFIATQAAIIPEPASLLLMGIGLLGAGIIARKKVRS